MIPFFDRFSGNTRSASQGEATPDLPSDGARATDVGRILEGIADAAETGNEFVNAFTGGSKGGKAVQRPVQTSQSTGFRGGLIIPFAVGVVVLVAAYFFFRKR